MSVPSHRTQYSNPLIFFRFAFFNRLQVAGLCLALHPPNGGQPGRKEVSTNRAIPPRPKHHRFIE